MLKLQISGSQRRLTSRVKWVLVAISSIVFALLASTDFWQQLESKSLDLFIVKTAPNAINLPIAIVGIDEDSFSEIGRQWPWPRGMHAKLVDRLVEGGASLIIFDVLFAEPSTPEEDAAFASAIKRAGNVILAAYRIERNSSLVKEWVRTDPLQTFIDAGARVGYATLPLDRDLVVRRMPEADDSLWRIATIALMQLQPVIKPDLGLPAGSVIRYSGPDHTFPFVPYHMVLSGSSSIPKDFFQDQIVIIGRDIQASPDLESAQADLFATPFVSYSGALTTGSEIHANMIASAVNRNTIQPAPLAATYVLLVLVAIASFFGLRDWHPLRSLLMQVATGSVVLLFAWAGLTFLNFWVPVLSSLTLLPAAYLLLGSREYLLELTQRKEITRAFSLYVTPQVVEYMISNPARIKLGGERRNVTIMFTDLAGFTSLSEQLAPEQVTHLLTRHFTVVTDIILEHQGTVVSFIGDAVMAIWGAPMDDDDPSYRAITTAILMQRAMQALRAEFEQAGLPAVRMRIGVHSGSAICGNMGSEKRFDYTAIGDDVNLAARLEGVNKLYGSDILLSGDTVFQLGGRISVRQLDRIIVKGKSQAIDVFTPCEDAKLVSLTDVAITYYRQQAWEQARLAFVGITETYPEDTLAQMYLQRIASFEVKPPPAGWSGAIELEKL